ncbi:MAG: ferrous iron transporter B [Planctomycetota bacterium]|nr:ferrous iron transporter B [Planctomycetota bacterium]
MVGTLRVALVGRPNSGKTSLLMHLTGSQQRPVNFPGTSVERVESRVQVGERGLVIADLPGIVSLEAHSRDEQVAIDSLRDTAAGPDLICAVLDAQKLVVELRFLQELRSLGRPMVVALTKLDLAEAAGRPIDLAQLRRALGLPVVVVNALSGSGVAQVREALLEGGSSDLQTSAADQELAESVQPAGASRRTGTDRLDAVLLHRFLGPVILVAVMLAMFQLVFRLAEPGMEWIEALQEVCGNFVGGLVPDGALQSFLVDGLINGLGSALIFIPQIALLIAVVTVLESSGYMARAVFLLDLVLRKVGLTGRSFVPMTSSFACAIPGIMASRIITDERDRLATIAVSPLMSCAARLPVYVVLLAAFFPADQAGLMLFLLYALGIVTAAGVAFVLRKTVLRGGHSPLAMELPAYQRPSLVMVGRQVWQAVRAFLITAGSVILVATVVVWLLAYYPRPASIAEQYETARTAAVAEQADEAELLKLDAQEQAAYLEQSWLASVGKTVQPVFAPAGFDWRMTVGVLAAFPARELIVPTLGTLHSLGEVEADPEEPDGGLLDALRSARDADGNPTMNGLVALALMAFFALCSQCAATLAAIRRETHSWRWPVFVFTYMTGLAWLVAVLIYQVGSWMGWGLPT